MSQLEVLKALKTKPMNRKEIANKVKQSDESVFAALKRLHLKGLIRRELKPQEGKNNHYVYSLTKEGEEIII